MDVIRKKYKIAKTAVGVLSQEVKRPEREVSGELKNVFKSIPPTFLHGVDMQNLNLTFNNNSSELRVLLPHYFPTQPQPQRGHLSNRGTNFSIPCRHKRPSHKWSHLAIIPFGAGITFFLQTA